MDTQELLDGIAAAHRKYVRQAVERGRKGDPQGGALHSLTMSLDESTPEGREYFETVDALLAEWRESNS